jgi:hypothetical protein
LSHGRVFGQLENNLPWLNVVGLQQVFDLLGKLTAAQRDRSTRVDQWVIEHTLAFMDANRRALPGLRLAINLSPVSARGC